MARVRCEDHVLEFFLEGLSVEGRERRERENWDHGVRRA
jgi:hypothetical protein